MQPVEREGAAVQILFKPCLFGGQGFKLTDAQEARIETLIDEPTGMVRTGCS